MTTTICMLATVHNFSTNRRSVQKNRYIENNIDNITQYCKLSNVRTLIHFTNLLFSLCYSCTPFEVLWHSVHANTRVTRDVVPFASLTKRVTRGACHS